MQPNQADVKPSIAPSRVCIDVTTRSSTGRSFIRLRTSGRLNAWSGTLALPAGEDPEEVRKFVNEKVKPVFNSYSHLIAPSKWDAMSYLQRLMLQRGWGEERALAVMIELEQKAMRGPEPKTVRDWRYVMTETLKPYGEALEPVQEELTEAAAASIRPEEVAPVTSVKPTPIASDNTSITVSEAYSRFIALKSGPAGDWKSSTESTHRANLRKIESLGLGTLAVECLTRSDLEEARLAMIDSGMRSGAINNVFRYLRQAINDCAIAYAADHDWDWQRTRQTLADFKPMKDTAAKVARHWSQEACQRADKALSEGLDVELSAKSTGSRQALQRGALWHLRLALATGARKSELEELRKDDIQIDPESGKAALHIRGTKTEAADRFIPLVDGLLGFPLGEFLEFIKTLPNGDSSVIHGRSIAGLTQDIREGYTLADGTGLTVHGLRHTFASNITAMGIDSKSFDTLMGHGGSDDRSLQKRYSTAAFELARKDWLTLHDKLTEVMTGKPTFMV